MKIILLLTQKFYRPAEVEYLRGSPTKAEDSLGWKRKVSFTDLVHKMLESDINNEQPEEAEIEPQTIS